MKFKHLPRDKSEKEAMGCKIITSIQGLIGEVEKDSAAWSEASRSWFRGEPREVTDPLLPKLFRNHHDEKQLPHNFRMKAPALGMPYVPPREYTNQWLFLTQHVRLPTR